MRTALWTLLIILIVALVAAIGGGWAYLRTSLPQTEGSITVSGLDDAVEIVRDADGVPHIYATTDHDAFFSLGYVHAQDRMWQMEIQRRIGAGRLSEILGERTLDIDKFLRTLGVYRATESSWEALNPQTQVILEAYAQGVNAWLDEKHTLPVEFLILGFEPQQWTVNDSMVWSKMMAWDLGSDYDVELLRVRLTQAVGAERAAQLLPAYPDDGIDILAASQFPAQLADNLLKLDSTLQLDFQLRGLDVGSNNWVIDGRHTEGGGPLLANDPHLGTQIPATWYLAELQGDQLHVVGATLPGLPGVVIGHNGQIAWGVTNMGPDVQDLYMERINPANPNQYEVDGAWVDMQIAEEIIYIDGEAEPLLWAARSTRHGPLISDVSDTTVPIAMRWTGLDEDDTTFETFLGVNYAQDWTEFRESMRSYIAPSQNFVYADIEGNIGYFAPGRLPIRDQGEGLFPVPGWNSQYEWGAYIPFDELPQAFNPEAGYIVTANNRVVDETYPYMLSNTWAPPYRAERITEMIEAGISDGQKLSLDDMKTIQADQKSTQVRELLPLLLAFEPANGRQAEALSYLEDWAGEMEMESVAASLYNVWSIHLARILFEDDLRGDLYEEMANRTHALFLNEVLSDSAQGDAWCDNVLSVAVESCEEMAQEALERTIVELTDRLGADMDIWRWSNLHITQYPHNPFSEVSFLRPMFHKSIANGGDSYTVNVAPIRLSSLYDQRNVPSYREVIDLADLNSSVFMNTTGQSGNVLSPHYDDLIERHRDVEYLPMYMAREGSEGERLRLEPKPDP